jgi:hypothetical protein
MIDRTDRVQPRFPASAEPQVQKAICEAIGAVTWTHPGPTFGLAGGASGGDLIFHECCEELGIPTRMLLALPPQEFEAESVAPAGPGWVNRFRALLHRAGPSRVSVMKAGEGETGNPWEAANLWMIDQATALAGEQALLALWDGQAGDGPGGTEHLLAVARERGVRVLPVIAMQTLVAPRG